MLSGICADCGQSHDHTPYEEAGTNDHGVTVSASQSLNANTGIQSTDPFIEGGIDEFTDNIWNSLNEENKVSMFVRFIDIETGKYETRIVNKNK